MTSDFENIVGSTIESPKKYAQYFITSLLICGISTAISVGLNSTGIIKENLLMVFLVGVLLSTALTTGYIYGFFASIISVFLFNYFFTEPIHTFIISNAQDMILLAFFLLAALICGTLSANFRKQMELATQNEKVARLMYEIMKSFLNLSGTESIVSHGIHYIYEHTGISCRVTLDSERLHSDQCVYQTTGFPDPAYEQNCFALPIKGLSSQIGTISLFSDSAQLPADSLMLIKTVVYQMALVLDREFISREREEIRLAMESEHLKTTLLRSVSHDIRTPLTGISGASSLIIEQADHMERDSIKRLAADINEESLWLIMTVQNILDMTRITDGKLSVMREFEAVDDLLNQAVSHLPASLQNSGRLHVTVPDEIFLVEVDGKLFTQVLLNLLDNAFKHSGNDAAIRLKAYPEGLNIIFEVSDDGCGIDPSILHTLFDGFVTVACNESDKGRGVGLGLSICKAIVEAHDGTLRAYNSPQGGAVFLIKLPCEEVTT